METGEQGTECLEMEESRVCVCVCVCDSAARNIRGDLIVLVVFSVFVLSVLYCWVFCASHQVSYHSFRVHFTVMTN